MSGDLASLFPRVNMIETSIAVMQAKHHALEEHVHDEAKHADRRHQELLHEVLWLRRGVVGLSLTIAASSVAIALSVSGAVG